MAFIDTKPPVAHSQGATPKVRKFSFSREEAARVVQAAFRGRLGRRNMRLRKVAKLMSLAVAGKTADSDEEGDVEGVMAQHLRFALRRRSTHKPSLALKAGSAPIFKTGSSEPELAATPEEPAGPSSPARASEGRGSPVEPLGHLGGLRIVPLSDPSERGSSTETDTRRVIDAAFLTWNVNGHAISREDARAWAATAGPADAYFIAIQELIDIEAKEGLPDRAVRHGANWAPHPAPRPAPHPVHAPRPSAPFTPHPAVHPTPHPAPHPAAHRALRAGCARGARGARGLVAPPTPPLNPSGA